MNRILANGIEADCEVASAPRYAFSLLLGSWTPGWRIPTRFLEDESPCKQKGAAVLTEAPDMWIRTHQTIQHQPIKSRNTASQPSESWEIIKHFYIKPINLGGCLLYSKTNRYKFKCQIVTNDHDNDSHEQLKFHTYQLNTTYLYRWIP